MTLTRSREAETRGNKRSGNKRSEYEPENRDVPSEACRAVLAVSLVKAPEAGPVIIALEAESYIR